MAPLQVFFVDDIHNALAADLVLALSCVRAHNGTNVEYCRGILDFARAQALNYGIPWACLVRDVKVTLAGDALGLLEG